MAKTIAVTGKGGTGKTAIAAMVLRVLIDAEQTPILAVDADPNANYHTTLGLEVDVTVGGIREEEVEERDLAPPGMSKPEYFEMRTRQALVESKGFDFLAMGRPEGPGCYCFPNNMLRGALERLESDYRWITVDCEAGLEHFSRRTTTNIDLLLILSDISRRGMDTVKNVLDLAESLGTSVKNIRVAVNRCEDGIPPPTAEAAEELDINIDASLPEDAEVNRRDVYGEPLKSVPEDNPLLAAVRRLLADVYPDIFDLSAAEAETTEDTNA